MRHERWEMAVCDARKRQAYRGRQRADSCRRRKKERKIRVPTSSEIGGRDWGGYNRWVSKMLGEKSWEKNELKVSRKCIFEGLKSVPPAGPLQVGSLWERGGKFLGKKCSKVLRAQREGLGAAFRLCISSCRYYRRTIPASSGSAWGWKYSTIVLSRWAPLFPHPMLACQQGRPLVVFG